MLSLHHLTALDLTAAQLVDVASELGCDAVCLFTHLAAHHAGRFPCIATEREAHEVAQRARDLGIAVCDLEVFGILPEFDLAALRPGLERGAILGATRATVHIRDPNERRAADHFARFCELAGSMSIIPGLEFTGFSVTRTIAAAAAVVRSSGAANAGVAVDALHVFRNGMSLADVAAHVPLITYAQLCDGTLVPAQADYYEEAVANRTVPGEGELPLEEFVRLLPPGVPIAVEVPMHRLRDSGVTALERARLAVNGARRVIGSASAKSRPNEASLLRSL
jgi:sugar phosphate isomerase/epimerase